MMGIGGTQEHGFTLNAASCRLWDLLVLAVLGSA